MNFGSGSLRTFSFYYLCNAASIGTVMDKIRYINLCIVEFGKRFNLSSRLAFNYLKAFSGLTFLDKHYEAEHLLPLEDTINDLVVYCQRHGGTLQ